ncbi:MAG TPA: 2-pyrone-4,6-dicarboxylate hydrolase [Gammaproteobacteria bacterium]|nr:2-pyrone-4,6-dicarboxylate hydrolase [Gammaproteobacteria bacterium]
MSNLLSLFDAHFHIIERGFPLVPNQGYLPEYFTIDDYKQQLAPLNIIGGAVVSGSFQAYDHAYLTQALKTLGPNYVGVMQLHPATDDEQLKQLNQLGVRAIRFNLKRLSDTPIDQLCHLANRVYELLGWHTELYVDSSQLNTLLPQIAHLPKVCIDHLGLSKSGFKTTLKMAESGAYLKASGFSRVDFSVPAALKDLYQANPEGLIFGTDLPGTRAPRGFDLRDYHLIVDGFDQAAAEKILFKNALTLYQPIAYPVITTEL